MSSIAFGVPVKPGKTQESKAFIEELLDAKGGHFHENRKARGTRRITVFHQEWPVEQFIIYMEADDLHKAMRDHESDHESDHEFEAWFVKRYEELSGIHPDKITAQMSQVVMDWHHEKGGSRKHHA